MVTSMPPAPKPGQPVTVPNDILPDWLKAHNLTIIRFDEFGRAWVGPPPLSAPAGEPVPPLINKKQ
jgi:hypothetical protein